MNVETTIATVPFTRLLRTELRKLVDTRSGRWLLIAILATTPIVVTVMLIVAKPGDLTYERFVDFTQTPQKILLPIVGILTVTSEWSQRTGLVTFTLETDRRRDLLAKAGATMLLGLLVMTVTFSSEAIGNLLGIALDEHDVTGRHWAQRLVATLLWIAVPAIFGVARVLRSEVASQ